MLQEKICTREGLRIRKKRVKAKQAGKRMEDGPQTGSRHKEIEAANELNDRSRKWPDAPSTLLCAKKKGEKRGEKRSEVK